MEVGQGPNWGCSTKEKKIPTQVTPLHRSNRLMARDFAWYANSHQEIPYG
jgi:hypothetical protein